MPFPLAALMFSPLRRCLPAAWAPGDRCRPWSLFNRVSDQVIDHFSTGPDRSLQLGLRKLAGVSPRAPPIKGVRLLAPSSNQTLRRSTCSTNHRASLQSKRAGLLNGAKTTNAVANHVTATTQQRCEVQQCKRRRNADNKNNPVNKHEQIMRLISAD